MKNAAKMNPTSQPWICPGAYSFDYRSPYEVTNREIAQLKGTWGSDFMFVSLPAAAFNQLYGNEMSAACYTDNSRAHILVRDGKVSDSDMFHEVKHAKLQTVDCLPRFYLEPPIAVEGGLSNINSICNEIEHFIFLPEEIETAGTARKWKQIYGQHFRIPRHASEVSAKNDLYLSWLISRRLFADQAYRFGIFTMLKARKWQDEAEALFATVRDAKSHSEIIKSFSRLPSLYGEHPPISAQNQRLCLRSIDPQARQFVFHQL